jgi:plasmid stabilization system protein ParE
VSHTVLWTPRAEGRLATIWLHARDREAISSAAKMIDDLLRDDPLAQGESRFANVRVMFARPLGVEYEVVEDTKRVIVLNVWSFA